MHVHELLLQYAGAKSWLWHLIRDNFKWTHLSASAKEIAKAVMRAI